MKNIIILLFVFFSITCNNNDMIVSVVDVDGLYKSIKKNNKSSFILLNIWSTYCLPCIEEIPYVVNLENRYDRKSTISEIKSAYNVFLFKITK